MQKNYIVNTNFGLYNVFFEDGNLICQNISEKLEKPRILIEGISSNFELSIPKPDVFEILWQSREGVVKTAVTKGGAKTSLVISSGDPAFFGYFLMQEQGKNRQHYTATIADEHYAIFYHDIQPQKTVFGYREVYHGQIGKFQPIFAGNVSDFSVAANPKGLHITYIKSGYFGHSITYQKVDENGLSPQISVASSASGPVLLYIEDGEVCISFSRDNKFFLTKSNEIGIASFRPPIHLQTNPAKKAFYIGKPLSGFRLSEVFVDKNTPPKIFPEAKPHPAPNTNFGADNLGTEEDYADFFTQKI